MELQNIRRIAVFKLRNIGDVLMITPALRALRETFPQARITVIVNSGTEAMLAFNPHINEVLVYRRKSADVRMSLFRRVGNELNFVRQLRRRRFDLTIGFTDGDRTAWCSFFSGARYRLGTAHYLRSRFNPQRYIFNLPAPSSTPPMPEVLKHFHILEKAGLKLRSTEPGPLTLVIPDHLRAWAREQLEPLRGGPIVHVHPVARWLWKCWSNESMAEVIDWLQTERGARVVVTSGPVARERKRASAIVRICRTKPVFYNGDLSLTQIAALSSQASCYFGVDTAPMHMAAAVGIPVIALFGPTVEGTWAPWTDRKSVISHACPCRETGKKSCDWNQVRACLASIKPEEAKRALDQVLLGAQILN